jgi:protein-tyrosine phosphatase
MTRLNDKLSIGTTDDFFFHNGAKVNLSGSYHRSHVHEGMKLDAKSHCYLICEQPNLLSVNWVDATDPAYFNYNNQGVTVCKRIMEFIDRHPHTLIACDQGISRSPSIALLYIYRLTTLDYDHSAEIFKKDYPSYNPGKGISSFLRDNWEAI